MTADQYLSTTYANEDQFTAATFRYINANYPAVRHLFFHIPNEQSTSDLMRMKMAGMGVLPGVPDFLFLRPVPWGLELKMPNGVLSTRQKALHALWIQNGIAVHTAWNAQQVLEVLEKMLT